MTTTDLARPARNPFERLFDALLALTQRFDGVRLESLAVTKQEFAAAEGALTTEQHAAIERAIDNVRGFHAAQVSPPLHVEVGGAGELEFRLTVAGAHENITVSGAPAAPGCVKDIRHEPKRGRALPERRVTGLANYEINRRSARRKCTGTARRTAKNSARMGTG